MSKIPCELIRDLFPSYIDKLTSDTSNQIIEEHVSECGECSNILNDMKAEYDKPHTATDAELIEIDFLKKNKRKNKKILIASLSVILIIFTVLALRLYVIGDYMSGQWFWFKVTAGYGDGYTGREPITFDARPNDGVHAISSVSYEEEPGVLKIRTKAVLSSPLHNGDYHSVYSPATALEQIYVNDRIVWSNGNEISEYTSDIYNTAHEYMGDMSANNETANALGLSDRLGPFENKLYSSKQPYGWEIKLQDRIPADDLAKKTRYMKAFAYTALGIIGNLDEVIFIYDTEAGEHVTKTYNIELANDLLGYDVKSCKDNIDNLYDLLVRTGLESGL